MVSALALSSCSDFLTKEPVLSQSTELTLSTYKGLNDAVLGAYAPLADAAWYGADYILNAEMMSGNGRRDQDGDFNSNRYTVEYTFSFAEDNTSSIWGFGYYVISAVNNVLANLDGKADGVNVTEQDIANIKAEALFLRALAHFDLVKTFGQPYSEATKDVPNGGVPVVLATDPTAKPARNTIDEVYSQIIADLVEAESIIDPEYSRSGVTSAKASVNIYSIQALLARAYQYKGDWQSAADYADKVISSGAFSLWSADEFVDPATWGAVSAADSGEVIFEIFNDKGNKYSNSWDDISWVVDPDGYADCQISNDVLSTFEAGDVRNSDGIMVSHPDGGDRRWSGKYPGKDGTQPDINNIIVLRLSEMYLIRAEALVNGASISGASAADDVNAIRTHRGLGELTSVGREAIKNEYRWEFLYEGHYYFDLGRWGDDVVRVDYSGANNQNVPAGSAKRVWPISKSELDVNPSLVQNPEY